MSSILMIAIGSLAGGFSRYYLTKIIYHGFGNTFPYGTLTVNLIGCLLAGLIASFAGTRFPLSASARILLISGFCGAFTTFSALIIESDFLLRNGHIGTTLLNVLASLVGGFALFRLGVLLGELG